jgi:uncharacterized protein (TIGR04255 family)
VKLRDRKHYDAPPLVEAVFELFADPTAVTAWEKVPVERVRSRLEEYAGDEQQLQDVLSFEVGPNGITSNVNPAAHRVRLWNVAHTKAVQFGTQMCAHNVLAAAYLHFEDHLESIQNVFATFLDEARPQNLYWLGQRYINQITIPVSDLDVASYFQIYPQLPAGLVAGHRPIAVQLETSTWETGTAIVNLSFRSVNNESALYVLDIYARSKDQLPHDAQALINWQMRAHDAISESFELSITDKCRRLFKERL